MLFAVATPAPLILQARLLRMNLLLYTYGH
jgi:hypothetical protein